MAAAQGTGRHLTQSPFDDRPPPEKKSEPAIGWREQCLPAKYERWRASDSGDQAWSYWLLAIAGTTLAGSVYGLPFFIIGAFFGLSIAGAYSMLLAPPFAIAVRSLCGTWRHPLAAPCFGGLIGFVSTSPIWDEIFRFDAQAIFLLVLGPMTTTALGQAGGYLLTRHDHLEMVVRKARKGGAWRFSIRTAMIATAWLAVVLALLQGLGALVDDVLAMLAWWLPWQALLLWGWSRLGRRAAARAIREGRFR